MSPTPAEVEKVVRDFVARVKPEAPEVAADTPLYADGVGLDSLETAELSATLEDELGSDPYSSEPMPQTLADITAYFAGAPAQA